ncbi:MAG: hypothetical protein ACI8UO_001926 [Verrucomicrobiales bacterium]|jgi:hypothetical protein
MLLLFRLFGKSDSSGQMKGVLMLTEIVTRAKERQTLIQSRLPPDDEKFGAENQRVHEIADAVSRVAEQVGPRTGGLRNFFRLSNLRLFIGLALIAFLAIWVWANFLRSRSVVIAVTGHETELLEITKSRNPSVENWIEFQPTSGSNQSLEWLAEGKVDMAIIQAGTRLEADMTVLGTVRQEHVLFFVREGVFPFPKKGERPIVLTGGLGQGSHELGIEFFKAWGTEEPDWVFGWSDFAQNEAGSPIPERFEDVQAIFIVIDPVDELMHSGIARAKKEKFQMQPSSIGVFQSKFPHIKPITLEPGFFRRADPPVPGKPIDSYLVDNYLVVSESATTRQTLSAMEAFDLNESSGPFFSDFLASDRSTMIEDLANGSAIPINLVVILFALFGWELFRERGYIQELNGLISRVSIVQTDQDPFRWQDEASIRHGCDFLDSCADLLGVISTISAYYGEVRPAIVFNGMTTMLDSRASDLRLNIQVKLNQGVTMLEARKPAPAKKAARKRAAKKSTRSPKA